MQLDQILGLPRSNSSEFVAERTLAERSHQCLLSRLEVTTSHLACVFNATICVCLRMFASACEHGWQCWPCDSWKINSPMLRYIFRGPAVFSQTLPRLPEWEAARSLWVYLDRAPSEENSAPCPLICMDFYGVCTSMVRSYLRGVHEADLAEAKFLSKKILSRNKENALLLMVTHNGLCTCKGFFVCLFF